MMNFEEWQNDISENIKADTLWKMSVYRYALFLGDLGWYDVTKLQQDHRTKGVSDQLYRALGSVSANIAEGYSRGSNKERAHFYEYSLGSARESRDWYHKGRHILGDTVVEHRMNMLVQIIKLLLTMVPEQRGRYIKEEQATYSTEHNINDLLANVTYAE
jgi:four helix bundle protein